MPQDDTGKFSADISQRIIDEALKSVEKRRAEAEAAAAEGAPLGGSPSSPSGTHRVPGSSGSGTHRVPPSSGSGVHRVHAPASTGSGVHRVHEAAPPAPAAPPPAAEAAPGGVDPRDEELKTVKEQLELSMSRGRDLMQKLKDEHEKMLRSMADLENYKKRAAKEKEEVQKFGSEKLLKDVLPVFDNMDRALEHAKSSADFDSFKKGVEMIRKLFEDTLGKHGVRSFSAKGKVFDPTQHEAMTSAETTEMPPNHVHSEVLRGWLLNDRLVRPALVVVSKAPAAAAAPEAPPATAPAADKPPDSEGGTPAA